MYGRDSPTLPGRDSSVDGSILRRHNGHGRKDPFVQRIRY